MDTFLISIVAVALVTVVVMIPGLYIAGWIGVLVDRYPPLGWILALAVISNVTMVIVRDGMDALVSLTVTVFVLWLAYGLIQAVRNS